MTTSVERDPTPEMLASPVFEAIWQTIKDWDIRRPGAGGYHGPTGTDVRAIYEAIAALQPNTGEQA